MNYIGKFFSNFKDVYNEINPATLTGAIDAVVVRQEDGSYLSSPFHVRFGKIGVLRSREKVVDIEINGQSVDIHMKLGESGEAFFVEEIEDGAEVSDLLGTSPLPNYDHFGPNEDDVRSQDSGVDAEEIYAKTLKDDPVKLHQEAAAAEAETSAGSDVNPQVEQSYVEEGSLEATKEETPFAINLESGILSHTTITHIKEDDLERVTEELTPAFIGATAVIDSTIHVVDDSTAVVEGSSKSKQDELVRSLSLTSDICLLQASNNISLEGQGSKTDVEDSPKYSSRSTRRRRKKRVNSKKYRMIAPDCPSSENSTTSETADLSSLSVTGIVSGYDPLFMDDFTTSHNENSLQTSLPNICHRENSKDDWLRTMGPDFHPFSDTDISPPPSQHNSRCNTPVKSDTEYEYEKQKSELSEKASQSRENKWSWTWGELPTPPQHSRANLSLKTPLTESVSIDGAVSKGETLSQKEVAQRSMLGSMFNFMRATRKARRNPENDGIYLDDLNLDELDPEVAALYFPRNNVTGMRKGSFTGFRPVAKDDDLESGNGTSLPQSPHSMYGAVEGPKNIDSDFEDSTTRHPIFYYKGYNDLAFSACGSLHEYIDEPFPEDFFMQSLVTYDEFCENPDVIYNPNLVVRLDGKYMNWTTAAPQILSLVLFQRPLPKKVIDNVALDNMPKKEMRKRTASKGYSWFSWGRNNEVSTQKSATSTEEAKQSGDNEGVSCNAQTVSSKELLTVEDSSNAAAENAESLRKSESVTVTCEPVEVPKDEKQRTRNDSSGSDGADVKVEAKRFRKTMRLSNEQINKLNLKYGSNEVVFSVTTAYQGTTICKCHIFLWNYDEKIVISDIDGTITKSDVLGHILPIMGKDWAQGGVAQLFTKIKNNGYHFLYLSARAIGQARITRDYLRSIKQGDVSLPDGPLLLNPTSLISAFHREVIEKKPEEFKISCLRDIKALFPSGTNPFYAGYGNRVNDVWAYSAVGIPISRIFTINHRGELKHELTQAFQTTYLGQVKLVDEMFPPIEKKMVPRNLLSYMYSEDEEKFLVNTTFDLVGRKVVIIKVSQTYANPFRMLQYFNLSDIAHHMFPPSAEMLGEYSSLQYWRQPLPVINIEEIEKAVADSSSK